MQWQVIHTSREKQDAAWKKGNDHWMSSLFWSFFATKENSIDPQEWQTSFQVY